MRCPDEQKGDCMEKKLPKAERRRLEIKNRLAANGMVTLGELCQALNCSESTIRSDLVLLEERGELRRTYGGAVPADVNTFGRDLEANYNLYAEEKRQLAEYIADQIILPGDAIIIDSGTTGVELARAVVQSRKSIRVITNNLPAAAILAKSDEVELYMSGGMYDHRSGSFDNLDYMRTMRANYFFLGATGVASESGFTLLNANGAANKRVMLELAAKTIAVLDHSKLNVVGLKLVCRLDEVDSIITDSGASPEAVGKLTDAGARVIVVPGEHHPTAD